VGTSSTVNNLAAGQYTLTVTDNCSSVTCNVTIGGPTAAVSSSETHNNIVCFNGNTGSIDLTPSGGTSPYSYVWTASAGGVVPGGQANSQDLSGLVAGTYDVVITDANGTTGGCRATRSVTITQPAAGLALGTCSKVDATCTGNGQVSAGTVTNYVGTVHYSWKNSLDQVVGTSVTVTNLPPDTYTLTVTDNCSSKTCMVAIAGPAAIPAPTFCAVQPSLCGPKGSVTITFPSPATDVSFSIDNGTTWQASNIFNNLDGGSVTGIKVKIGDCISPAATCAASSCGGQSRMSNSVTSAEQPVTNSEAKEKIFTELPSKFSPTIVQEEIAFEVKAIPNPFNDRVKFVIASPEAGYGSLEVMNMLGQKVKTVYQGQIPRGVQSFEMVLPESRYSTLFYIFRMNGRQSTGKLIQRN